MCGNVLEKAGEAWIAGKAIFPQFELSFTPKIPLS